MAKAPPEKTEPLRLIYVDPADLKDNPRNWREHPPEQMKALEGAIGEVGWAGALLFNEATGRLIDGHARKKKFAGKGPVPVLVGSWSESDEQKILATLDPLAAMATANKEALESLMRDVQTGSEDLAAMLEKMAADEGIVPPTFEPVGINEQGRLDEKAKYKCPECGHEFTP